MTSMMISQSTFLYRVQTIDLTIDARNTRLNEIKTALESDAGVVAATKQHQAAESALTPLQTSARNLDLEIKSLAEKIKATEDRMYSGKVTNPKELKDMGAEIESLKKRQDQLETELLEAMVNVEEKQEALKTAAAALDVARQAAKNSQAGLHSEQETIQRELVELAAKRKTALANVEPANLAKYESLRAKRRGFVISPLKGDSCGICGVQQTSTLAQKVRQGAQIIVCENCGRILATP